ncbi:MAG TPA: TerD family protein [Candidatus Saccharimonadales bacterium]|nr:TerD family protein [Candidatus Saccharimonadales bacterium]
MPTLQVKKGDTKKLPPGDAYTVGVGWDPAADQSESPDLDVWVIRRYDDGRSEPIFWGNQDWHRPDLGTNSEGNPWVATPEEDVVYQGDDRTGASSATGYDEITTLTPSKAPAGLTQYAVFVTYYDDPEVDPPTKTLGMASNITCGVKNEVTGNELATNLEGDHAFDVTVLICTIDRAADGSWSMTAKQEGYTDSMIKVAKALGVDFG